MLFSSLTFLFIFLPVVIGIYYIAKTEYRNTILLIFSLVFYAWGEPRFLLMMILSILVNYFLGLAVYYYRNNIKLSKLIILICVVFNILFLGYYKYANFFIDNINSLFGAGIGIKNIALPLGISFFTFQAMSYVIDVYNGKEVQKNPLNVALYISLFPQLIAGPIVRYQTIASKINNRVVHSEDFSIGIKRFIIGLGKKVLLANNIGIVANEILSLNISDLTISLAWVGAIAYTLQIYFDFSGYSDMAIGLGRMFGFRFLENFNYPYISKSISEFWRRWHMSLGQWFRDYVYIPLGGNKVSKSKVYRNLLIVWMLTGLWHGAQWNFVIWGLYYGLIIMIEKAGWEKILKKTWNPIQHIYSLILVIIGWVLFACDSLIQSINYLKVMFGISNNILLDTRTEFYLVEYKYFFVIALIVSTPLIKVIMNKFKNKYRVISNTKIIICDVIYTLNYYIIFVLSIIYLINSTFNPFIYFRF